MSLTITQFAVGGYDDNFSYLITDPGTNQALYADPTGDTGLILSAIQSTPLTLMGIVLTHTHHDHIDQLGLVLTQHSVPVYVHESGVEAISAPAIVAVRDADAITLGDQQLTILHTPGHTPDSICLQIQTDDGPALVSGDTVFVHGCGRTDETGVRHLYESLQRIKTLPSETVLYPGHDYGPKKTSTLKEELTANQYLSAPDFETFKKRRLG